MFRYPVVIEKAGANYSAYSPDLPGCVATGTSIRETLNLMTEAIQLHIRAMERNGLHIPAPSTKIKYIEISL